MSKRNYLSTALEIKEARELARLFAAKRKARIARAKRNAALKALSDYADYCFRAR